MYSRTAEQLQQTPQDYEYIDSAQEIISPYPSIDELSTGDASLPLQRNSRSKPALTNGQRDATSTIIEHPKSRCAPPALPRSTKVKAHDNKVTKRVSQRTTCETCRTLKIKCVASTNGIACEKCVSKGINCVKLPRATYPARRKKLN